MVSVPHILSCFKKYPFGMFPLSLFLILLDFLFPSSPHSFLSSFHLCFQVIECLSGGEITFRNCKMFPSLLTLLLWQFITHCLVNISMSGDWCQECVGVYSVQLPELSCDNFFYNHQTIYDRTLDSKCLGPT